MVGEECLAAWKECREEEAFEACLFFYANCSPPSGTYAALAAVLRKWSREAGVRILHAAVIGSAAKGFRSKDIDVIVFIDYDPENPPTPEKLEELESTLKALWDAEMAIPHGLPALDPVVVAGYKPLDTHVDTDAAED